MSNVFYLPPELWGAQMELSGQEAQHAGVLRLKVGDEVIVLDGQGKIGCCKIVSVRKKSYALELVREEMAAPPNSRVIMAIALGKAARRGFFLEKASELGAWEIWFWNARRSIGKVSAQVLEAAKGRLIAGCKQSLNPWLPGLKAFDNIEGIAGAASSLDWKYVPWEEENSSHILLPDQLGKLGQGIYVIGPEGGITLEEMAALKDNGFAPVSLGRRVLRCETAAVLCLGLHWWGSQLPGHADGQA